LIEDSPAKRSLLVLHVHGVENRLVETTPDGQVASGVIRRADEP
jgi:hypothetical protein